MKRTLLVTIDFPPMVGGVANYWANLCRELPSDDLVVLAEEYDGSIDFDIHQGYLIYRKNLISRSEWLWPKWLPLFFCTLKMIKQEKIKKLIVAHILPTGTVALIIKKLFHIPYIVSVHGLDISLSQVSEKKRRLTKRIMSGAESIMANSEYTKGLLLKYNLCSAEKVEVVYPCSNIQDQKVPQKIKENLIARNNLIDKKVILTVGRLIERKGHDKLIQALPLVLEKVPNLFYISVGDGPQKKYLQEQVDALKLNDKTNFYYDVLDYELPAFYDLSDVFIMPCRELTNGDIEGFGIVFLEAGMYDKPVIGGRSGGAVEAVEQGVNGLLVDPNSINEIAQALISLLTNNEKAKTLGQQGHKRVIDKFNWQEQGKKIIEIVNK